VASIGEVETCGQYHSHGRETGESKGGLGGNNFW